MFLFCFCTEVAFFSKLDSLNCAFSLAGALLFLQVSNNRLVTDSHYLPPTVPDGDSQLQQQIVGSLSGLCQSCPPGAVTALPFKRGALRVLAVLADNTLSVVLVDQISHDVIQVCLIYCRLCLYLFFCAYYIQNRHNLILFMCR